MATFDAGPPPAVVAVAASAGGVEALSGFVAALPAEFPATVLIVLHIPSAGPSVLPSILSRAGKLPARHPVDGEKLTGGTILVAPPDRHMTVTRHHVHLFAGPRENGHRPACDTLLRSAAENFGTHSAGVVLSGTMDDGAAGLSAVRAVGGLALVQDPAEAAFPGMPLAAIEEADPQYVGVVGVLADQLSSWLGELPEIPAETAMTVSDEANAADTADLTELTCPECGGTLWHRNDYGAQRFRCRVGHSFSADGLMLGKQAALESALWAAIVALQERADVSRRIVRRLEQTGRTSQVERYQQDVAAAESRAKVLHGLIKELVQGVSMSYDEGNIVDTAS